MRILAVDELAPWLSSVASQQAFELRVQIKLVLFQVHLEVVRAHDLGNLDQLVVIIVAVEERLSFKDHGRKHAAQGPQVQRVVVVLQVD